MKSILSLFCFFIVHLTLWGQANGNLQIHFMNVGQGDGALLVSPQGETVLFDNGVRNNCDLPISYLQQLGVTAIDYHVASHYHDDHIGCTVQVFREFPLRKKAFDRGDRYKSATFTNYLTAVGSLRATAIEGDRLTLDANSPHPVQIEFVAVNGHDVPGARDENDMSLACVVRFRQFDAVIAGDLSGITDSGYRDIETSVCPNIGQVEVYKVNHHGSRYSSNPVWLSTLQPKLGVISCGDGNKHHHPTVECLDRLHAAGVFTFWTTAGGGVAPDPARDKVGGNIIIEMPATNTTFTVTYSGDKTNSYQVWNPISDDPTAPSITDFAWSQRSDVYHFANCKYVDNISPANLRTATTAPADKRLHTGCPKL